jgi:hypothetical protein
MATSAGWVPFDEVAAKRVAESAMLTDAMRRSRRLRIALPLLPVRGIVLNTS